MKAVILVLTTILFAVFLSGGSLIFGWTDHPLFIEDIRSNIIAGIAQVLGSIFLFFILFIVLLYRTPPQLHKEQEKQIDDLQEHARPKLQIKYSEGNPPYWQSERYSLIGDGEFYQGLFRIIVKNTSATETIEDINIGVVELEPEAVSWFKGELHIMHGEPRRLHPLRELAVDVIMVNQPIRDGEIQDEKSLHICYEAANIRNRTIRLQDYEIKIAASGRDTPTVSKSFKFTIDDEGNYRFFAKRGGRKKT